MGGGWFGERIGEAAKEARSRAKTTKDSPATGSGRLTATQKAEDHELPGPTIDLAVAPVAPVGKIGLRLQELLTPGPLVSDRRKPGGEGGISGDVGPGDSGPGAPARYNPWSSTAGFHPGRTSDCNRQSRILNSPISSGNSGVREALWPRGCKPLVYRRFLFLSSVRDLPFNGGEFSSASRELYCQCALSSGCVQAPLVAFSDDSADGRSYCVLPRGCPR
jgi:hypothetical protein